MGGKEKKKKRQTPPSLPASPAGAHPHAHTHRHTDTRTHTPAPPALRMPEPPPRGWGARSGTGSARGSGGGPALPTPLFSSPPSGSGSPRGDECCGQGARGDPGRRGLEERGRRTGWRLPAGIVCTQKKRSPGRLSCARSPQDARQMSPQVRLGAPRLPAPLPGLRFDLYRLLASLASPA